MKSKAEMSIILTVWGMLTFLLIHSFPIKSILLLNESGSLWEFEIVFVIVEEKVKHLILICMPATHHSFSFFFTHSSFHSSSLLWRKQQNAIITQDVSFNNFLFQFLTSSSSFDLFIPFKFVFRLTRTRMNFLSILYQLKLHNFQMPMNLCIYQAINFAVN